MSEINCTACQELKVTSPNFVENGITDTECTSLAADTGLNPNLTHNDATDLHNMNDCLVGRMTNDLEWYEICDWQDFMNRLIPNVYETIKGIICALGGVWTHIHNLITRVSNLETRMTNAENRITTLEGTVAGHTTQISNINDRIEEIIEAMGGSSNVIPVFKRYRYTVPAANFSQVWRADLSSSEQYLDGQWLPLTGGIVHWMAGSGHGSDQGQGEGVWIQIPVSEMESITGVWGQTWVLEGGNNYDGVGKPYMQTVSIQTWYQDGNYLIVNFDTHVTAPVRVASGGTVTQNGAPYPVTIDFLVTGTKTIET